MISLVRSQIKSLHTNKFNGVTRREIQSVYGAYINGKYVIPENSTYFNVNNPANMDPLCK